MSTPALIVFALALFVVLLLILVSGLVLVGLACVTHRNPRLEKPLGIAGSFAGVLVAAFAVLVAVVALTAQ